MNANSDASLYHHGPHNGHHSDWSLGEVQALAIKAARGAGFDWGLAEEVGFAMRWLEEVNLPGCASLAAYLGSREQLDAEPVACPIVAGTQLLDHRRPHPVELSKISHPLLLLPFVAAYAEKDCLLRWTDCTIYFNQNQVYIDATPAQLLCPLASCTTALTDNASWRDSVAGDGAGSAVAVSTTRTRIPNSNAAAIRQLQLWAGNTYAPATEQSRLSGAGAGVSDND